MTHTTHFIWVTSLLKPDTCKAIQWFSDYVSIFKVQSHTFSKCPLCSIAQAPAARHYLPIHSPFLDREFAWMWLSRLNCIYVWNVLTISAVWFLLRTALCRAVIPSFVLKSRCAPPLFSTLMSSAQLSSCAASVRGHSASRRKQRTLLKTQLISTDIIVHSSPKTSTTWIAAFFLGQNCLWLYIFNDSAVGSLPFSVEIVTLLSAGCFQLVLNQPILMFPSLRSSSATLQVTQHWNLLYDWTNICIYTRRLAKRVIQLYPLCRRLISENPYMVICDEDRRREMTNQGWRKTIINNK